MPLPSRSPRRVVDLIRLLVDTAGREQVARRRLREATAAVLDAPTEGPEELAPIAVAVASSRGLDSCALLLRRGARWAIAAGAGLHAEAPREVDGGTLVADAAGARRAALGAGQAAAPPLPPGTRAAAAAPILARGEVVGVALAGTRSADAVDEEDVLLLRLAAERAGRGLERRELVEALAAAEATLRRTDAFRDQILAIVGHDLRNPLGAIVMSAALLAKRGGLAGWQHKTVSRVRSSAARMHRIIDDLLSYTRTRLGSGIPIAPRSADLGELARRVVDELVAFHPERPIHVEVAGDLAGDWDPARLEQVLSNLVSNAIDHGEDEQRIEVLLRGGGDGVEVEIANRGEMPPVVLEHAFEAFRRAPEAGARRASGLGLGLYIAREIVHGHGGRIDLRSGDGETRVRVHLPRRAGPAVHAGGP